MGGEKRSISAVSAALVGSPPRGRGKAASVAEGRFRDGITPAWAGKSVKRLGKAAQGEDHPRVGGEKSRSSAPLRPTLGSPPRGRGKAPTRTRSSSWSRITPAWAGKRPQRGCDGWPLQDHPRVGGEKTVSWSWRWSRAGSPPRGRGKEGRIEDKDAKERITPAWAGKRLKRSHRSGIFISGPIPFHSVLHRPAGSGGSRAGRDGSPAGQPQNAGPA